MGELIGLSLRRHGLIPFEGGPAAAECPLVLTPIGFEIDEALGAAAGVIEGPLPDADLARLELTGRRGVATSLAVSGDGLAEAKLVSQKFTIRHHTERDGNPALEAVPGGYSLGASEDGAFAYMAFEPNERWRPVLEGVVDDSGSPVVLVVTDGRLTVSGFSCLHMLSAALGWPDLESGYYAFETYSQTNALEWWLIAHIDALARAHRVLTTHVSPWPKGRDWVLLIRHDYDRLITDTQFAEMIETYDALGVRPNWFFLPHKLIEHQARRLLEAGHEVALHTTASSKHEFEEQHRALSRVIGRPALGVTAHGGDYPGFLGDLQYAWAEGCAMTYSELMGANFGFPFIGSSLRGGAPRALDLVLMPSHVSLDAGTQEHQHHFDLCLRYAKDRRKQGAGFQIMNHPDIHRGLLRTLLDQSDVETSWRPTMPELADWCRATRYDVALRREGDRVVLSGSKPRKEDAVVRWTCGEDDRRTEVWSADADEIAFELRSESCV